METAWNTCNRGDWMILALRSINPIPQKGFWVKFAKRCALQVKKYSNAADAAADELQAKWIRKNLEYPFKGNKVK